jgi:hypothetical protein
MFKATFLSGLLFSSGAFAGANDLHWLAGHWCGTTKGGVMNEEIWLAPRAGSLLGMHRDSKDGKFVGFEFFRIVEDGAELVYWTQPSGRPAIAFRAKKVGNDSVSFLKPDHDFPKRITYRRIDADTLMARIDDGTDSGKSMEWRWSNCAKQ